MSHSLLSLTGKFTPQPVSKKDINLIFNGQIYNYDSSKYSSDSYFILDEYIKNPKLFWKSLDGEYAIVIHDSKNNMVTFLTDIFGTKPLYYSVKQKIITISSLKSTLKENGHTNIIKCKPNTIYSFDLINSKLQIEEEYFKFNLDQYIDSFDGWNEKFIESEFTALNVMRLGEMMIKIDYPETGCELLNNVQNEVPPVNDDIYLETEQLMKTYECPKVVTTDGEIMLANLIKDAKELIQ